MNATAIRYLVIIERTGVAEALSFEPVWCDTQGDVARKTLEFFRMPGAYRMTVRVQRTEEKEKS